MQPIHRYTAWLLAVSLTLLAPAPQTVLAQAEDTAGSVPVPTDTVETLSDLVGLRTQLKADISALGKELRDAQTEIEKEALARELADREADLLATTRNFENIAAGVDMSGFRAEPNPEFNFQEELFGLLKPAIDELKEMTAHVRQKSSLKEKIAYYEARVPVVERALAHVDRLLGGTEDQPLKQALATSAGAWRKQLTFMQSELQAARLQLEKLTASETSITEASRSYLKSFFQKRGLYLTEALLVVLGIALLARLSHSALHRYIPGFRARHRSFRIRLVELIHRLVTLLLLILGPMTVFYLVEDWVLFSLGILLLLGIAWTLRQTLPRYWHQIQIFLNIGSVREGERIFMDGLPWVVKQINVYCTLANPTAELTQRVPIDDLVDLKSRPCAPDEPWFPCRKGDWVILSDGVRGKVIGLSPELVRLVERGGAELTYPTGTFLAASPRNLATNFRIKEILGISYALQRQATNQIPETLTTYLQQRVAEDGYAEQLLNLRVEFAQANSSSLDLVVVADFKGDLADLYNRLRRAIQRWCVDACTQYGWEIPYPQMTLSGSLGERS
jgi:hypothetical protein